MSISVGQVSAYQQAQNWRSAQTNITNNLMGSLGSTSSSSINYAFAFGGAASNYYVNSATLAAQEALSRVQQQVYDKSGASKASGASAVDQKLSAAKTAGNAILAAFGYGGSYVNNSTSGSSTPSSSAPYAAPINAATGYSYVSTSAASLSTIGALNMFA